MNLNRASSDFEAAIAQMKVRGVVGQASQINTDPKYVEWFEGKRSERKPLSSPPVNVAVAAPKSANSLIAEQTIFKLNAVGTALHHAVVRRLPEVHRMQQAIKARLLKDIPQLGSCRIGRVVLKRQDDRFSVAEFYVTNFDAKISTMLPDFYTMQSKAEDQMFFGVGVFTDRYGRTLEFDRSLGNDGIYFQTKRLAKAIYSMASISTGMTINQLKELDKNNFPEFENSSS